MKTQTDKTQEIQKEAVQRVEQEPSTGGEATIVDNRPAIAIQCKLRSGIDDSKNKTTPIQRKNNTGLPDRLKSGIENLSGYSMDDVKVHYNSSKPAQLQAYAYTQGTDIHVAPRQEKHLPHEAWHVVQQKQGRVKPTIQFKGEVNINDDAGLEKEADVMGAKAASKFSQNETTQLKKVSLPTNIVQKASWVKDKNIFMWNEVKDGLTWFADESGMWFAITDYNAIKKVNPANYRALEGKVKTWAEWSKIRIESYPLQNPEASTEIEDYSGFQVPGDLTIPTEGRISPTDKKLESWKILYYLITQTNKKLDSFIDKPPFISLPKFKLKQFVATFDPEAKAKAEDEAELKEAEAAMQTYLSSGYKWINSLASALSELDYDPTQFVTLDISSNKEKIVQIWRKIAVGRGYLAENFVKTSLTVETLDTWMDRLRLQSKHWDSLGKKRNDEVLFRGDSNHLYDSYPFLNPDINDYEDGEHNINKLISWPGTMSSTYGNPMEHNFINKKTIIWHFTLKSGHRGRVIGNNNASEEEVTFPPGNLINIKKILVRRKDKTVLASTYGTSAEIIIWAET